MSTLKRIYLAFVCYCFVQNVHGGETFRNSESQQPKTYFDIIYDVTGKVQAVNGKDIEHGARAADLLFSVIKTIYKPLISDVADEFSSGGHSKPLDNFQFNSFLGGLNSSSTCINDTGRIITSLATSEHWAAQFFDASGKPGPGLLKLHFRFVGDYDECKSARAPPIFNENTTQNGFDGSYCIISFLTEIPFLAASLGACLPSTCSSDEISHLMYDIIGFLKSQPPIIGVSTQCLKAETKVTTATVFALLILSMVGVLMFIGTIYDVMTENDVSNTQAQNESQRNSQRIRHNTSYESISSLTDKEWNKSSTNRESSPFFNRTKSQSSASDFNEKSTLAKVLLSFSVYSNSKKILNSNQSSGSLGAIHGMRFLSMSWVVLGHMYTNVLYFAINSLEEMSELLKRWSFLPIANGLVSVDTFFTLSGLLTSYLTIQEMSRRNTWKINWPMFYFHRFWRLTPPYMFSIVIFLGLQQYMGQGPMWTNQQPADKEFCEKNWWTNLLYLNNLVKFKEGCFGHSWYLANDMQFFILSPLMLIPFYYSRISGMLSCLLFLLVSWITTGVLSTSHKWPTTTLTLKPVPGQASQLDWMEHYYVVPWCRIGPFVVGIFAGYVLALTRGSPFRMHRLVVFIGWVTALTSGFAIVYGVRGDITGDNPSSLKASSFYNAVHRTIWGACISWVVIACSAGYGGPVNKLLSWSPFVVLGRLTYMSYLIHINLIAVFFSNFGTLYYANDTTLSIIYLGLLVFINMAAFVCVLALESPMVGLEKAFIRKEKRDG